MKHDDPFSLSLSLSLSLSAFNFLCETLLEKTAWVFQIVGSTEQRLFKISENVCTKTETESFLGKVIHSFLPSSNLKVCQ